MNTNNNNNSKTDWSKRDVGALWKREGKNQKYLSGYIKVDESDPTRELKIIVFTNKNKNENQKAPDYRIYISEQRNSEQPAAKQSFAKQSEKPLRSKPQVKQVVEEDEDLL